MVQNLSEYAKEMPHAQISENPKTSREREYKNIYHECEDWIEKSAQRIPRSSSRACRVMTNSDHEELIFLSPPHMNNRFIFLLTINIMIKYHNFIFDKKALKCS